VLPGGMDPGLGVFFMDLCTHAIDPTLEYDEDGSMARAATTNDELLEHMLQNKYYAEERELPIGVGPDDFPETLFKEYHTKAKELGVSDPDFLSTLTELTAVQIARACAKHGGPHVTNGATDDVLLRGGVCANSYFVERLRVNMSKELGTEVARISTLDDVSQPPPSEPAAAASAASAALAVALSACFSCRFARLHQALSYATPHCTALLWTAAGRN
jgi:1,6-anhydro-N-acetylmuramate kinase